MRNRVSRLRKNWLPFEVRKEFAQAWSHRFLEAKNSRHPAEFCFSVIDQCWHDLFGPKASNGKRPLSRGLFPRRYRSLPDAALMTLEKWQAGEISLRLLSHVPTPLEVLKAQAMGERYVSAMVTRDNILYFEEGGRDFLSFLIHDLVHAQHFLSDSESSRRQIRFAQEMLPIVNSRVFDNSQLKTEFEYLISDMNSHLIHLLKTLKSLSDRLGNPQVAAALERQIPLWNELNSPRETRETHERLLQAWDSPAIP